MIDPITDDDLAAFVDGQIDPMRRLDVEAYLAAEPAAAARVMADLHDRDALRACFAPAEGARNGDRDRDWDGPGPDRNVALARRLDRSFRWRRVGARLKRAAAVAVLVGAGWLAHDEIGRFGVPDTLASTPDPALIDDARQARSAMLLRRIIADPADESGSAPAYDRARLRAATGLGLPAVPAGWRVRDIEVFPARHGVGVDVEVTFDAGELGEASLFATRAGRDGPAALSDSSDGSVYAWTAGGTAYALSGPRDDTALRRAASLLGGS